jgi:hypothetical protein
MSEKTALTTEQIEKIAGGECTAQEAFTLINNLTAAYESLIDFTSYVMERVSNS